MSTRLKRDFGLSARMILSFIILGILYVLFLSVLHYLGIGYIPLAIIASAMILAQWYFSDKIVVWTSGAKIVSKDDYPKLHEIIERLASKNGIPKPKVAVVNTHVPNAFATGKSPKSSLVAVTSGILNLLDDDELEAVIGHELTHGFDANGSQYDPYGNLKNWWTPATKAQFDKKAQCYKDQASQYFIQSVGLNVDGNQTIDEN